MKSKNFDLVLFSSLFTGLYVIANVIAVKQVEILGMVVACSFITYPLTFVVSNIVSERLGIKDARKVVFSGLITMIVIMLLTSISYYLTATDKEIQSSYQLLFENNVLILLASIATFVVSQVINFTIYNGIRASKLLKYLMSILISLFVDALLFKTLLWYFGISSGEVFTGVLNQTIFGLLVILIAIPFFYIFTVDTKNKTK